MPNRQLRKHKKTQLKQTIKSKVWQVVLRKKREVNFTSLFLRCNYKWGPQQISVANLLGRGATDSETRGNEQSE